MADDTATTGTTSTAATTDTSKSATTTQATTAGDAAATGTAQTTTDKGDTKTILEGGGTDKTATAPADWPADWRTKGLTAAGLPADDKQALALLERLGSPGDLVKKVLEQEKFIREGKHKAGLPKDATAEQLAAYRKENNIPETADKYDLTLPDGLVIGETDKPIINNMLTAMHGQNLNNEQVKSVLAAYYQQEKAFLQERDAGISTMKVKQDDQLHAEWGNEYRPNLNAIGSLVKTFSETTRSALAGAVDSEGFPLLNNPSFLKDMAVMARTINPIDTVVSTGGGSQMSSVDDEIKSIEARMGSPDQAVRDAYFKDEPAQKRVRQLYEWRESQKKRA